MHWGYPISYPDGDSGVTRVLLHFSCLDRQVQPIAHCLINALDLWFQRFVDYFELLTKQRREKSVRLARTTSLDLFMWGNDGKACRPYAQGPDSLIVRLLPRECLLTITSLTEICNLASSERPPALEYKIQLGAYRALREGDYRKAIIEAAAAAEIVVTSALKIYFTATAIQYGDKLLAKYRMLGGRLELARVVGLPLPPCDYDSHLLEPRNAVIHKAAGGSEIEARNAITVADALLSRFCPAYAE